MKNRKNKLIAIMSFLCILSFVFSACSGPSSRYNTSEMRLKSGYNAEESYSPDYNPEPETAPERRKIKSYNISGDTRDFDKTYSEIKENISKEKGYIDTSNYSNEDIKTVNISAYVPKDNVETFLKNVKSLDGFNLLSEREYAEDVENTYTDIETRLSVLEKRLAKLEELQKEQTDVDAILNLEDRINNTVSEIENLKGNKKELDTVVEYSRVDIYLKEVYKADSASKPQETRFIDDIKTAFSDAGWLYKNIFRGLVYILIKYSLLILLGLGIWYIMKKNDKKIQERRARRLEEDKKYKENKENKEK